MSSADHSFAYIQGAYKVPAERGRRVTCSGREGTIVAAEGPYIRVVLDGDKRSGLYHPTWKTTYGDIGELPPAAKRWYCLPPWRDNWIDAFEVMAETRSKARYLAYLELLDVGIEPRGMLYIKVRAA